MLGDILELAVQGACEVGKPSAFERLSTLADAVEQGRIDVLDRARWEGAE